LKIDFVPDPVTKEQGELIRKAVKWAKAKTEEDITKAGNRSIYKQRRTLNFVKAFDKLTQIDDSFKLIAELFMNLADKIGAYIFDIQPDNFRVNSSGDIILVDPSVPDLFGDFQKPRKLLYEERLTFVGAYNILYYE
jgi:DNA-directed RNA polymerase subunit F